MAARTDPNDGFEKLAEENLHPLYSMAVRLTRQPQEAEDLVQETLLRAYRFFDKYERGTNFKAWIFKILKNAFINRYRKAQTEPATVDFGAIEEGLETLVDGVSPGTQAAPSDPESILMQGAVDGEIEGALDELPPEYRMVLLMAVVEEMSYKEIAAALSIPIGTVMSRLHRARRLLQGRLVEYGHRRGLISGRRESPPVVDISQFRRGKP
jgi:RNA polymerase sigma-70 factor (ECF subfamily)